MSKKRVVATVRRTIAAKPREVFDAWTDPKKLASPWSKRNGVRTVVMEPAAGTLFFINMGPPMPLPTHFGRFLRLERPGLIEHTWASEGTSGAETRVRISLKAKGDGTTFTLRHTGLPNSASARAHEEGWGMIGGWLADGFGAQRS